MWLGFSAAALSVVGHERARGSSKSRDVSYETHAIHAFAFTIARGRSLDTSPEDVFRGKLAIRTNEGNAGEMWDLASPGSYWYAY